MSFPTKTKSEIRIHMELLFYRWFDRNLKRLTNVYNESYSTEEYSEHAY